MANTDVAKIVVIGNWELCLAVVNALVPANTNAEDINCRVTVLTYPSQTLSLPGHVTPSIVEHRRSDFSSHSLQAAFSGHDSIVSTMSGGDAELQIRIIDAAVAAGVRKFIPHEFGHDTRNQRIQSRIVNYSGRAKVLQHLEATSTTELGLEWVGIATGCTLDRGLISGDLGFDMEWHSATIHGIGTELFAASSLKRVGEVILRAIRNWDKVKNTYIYTASVVTSANEVLRSAETVTEQEWTVGNYDVEDCIREGQKRIE